MPIVVQGFRTTLPLALLDSRGNRAMVHTNCAPWDAWKIRDLRHWIAAMRQGAGDSVAFFYVGLKSRGSWGSGAPKKG